MKHTLLLLLMGCFFLQNSYAQEVTPKAEFELESEVDYSPEIFTIVEEMPEFPGGREALFKFLDENVKYPVAARENGIEGTVYVSFLIKEDGTVINPEIKRGLPKGGNGCDAEALRVVKLMPTWKAGKQMGKLVKVAYTLPVRFKLKKIRNPQQKTSTSNETIKKLQEKRRNE